MTEWKMFEEFVLFLILMIGGWSVTAIWDRWSGANSANNIFHDLRGSASGRGWVHRIFVGGMIVGFCGCTVILFVWAATDN